MATPKILSILLSTNGKLRPLVSFAVPIASQMVALTSEDRSRHLVVHQYDVNHKTVGSKFNLLQVFRDWELLLQAVIWLTTWYRCLRHQNIVHTANVNPFSMSEMIPAFINTANTILLVPVLYIGDCEHGLQSRRLVQASVRRLQKHLHDRLFVINPVFQHQTLS